MIGRRLEPLVNATEEDRLIQEPFLKFSFYLSGRNNIVISLLDEIIDLLEKGFEPQDKIDDASTKAWFWNLGAYEIIRTISQSKKCFTEEFYSKMLQ